MLCSALEDEAALSPSDVEIVRDGPSYTVETLEEIRRRSGSDEPIVWVIGRDAYDFVPNWHRVDDVACLGHFLVFDRGADSPPRTHHGFRVANGPADLRNHRSGRVWFVDESPPPVSSTAVRAMMARGENASALLPRKVWAYIESHSLYRSSDERQGEGKA